MASRSDTGKHSSEKDAEVLINPLTVFPKASSAKEAAPSQTHSENLTAAKADYLRGIQTSEPHPEPAAAPSASVYTSLLQWVASQPNGSHAQATIDDPALGRSIFAQLDRDYFSAAGLQCRRIRLHRPANGPLNDFASVCLERNGEWVLATRIAPRIHVDR